MSLFLIGWQGVAGEGEGQLMINCLNIDERVGLHIFSPRAISLKSILIQDQFIEWCLIFLFTMFSKMTACVDRQTCNLKQTHFDRHVGHCCHSFGRFLRWCSANLVNHRAHKAPVHLSRFKAFLYFQIPAGQKAFASMKTHVSLRLPLPRLRSRRNITRK